MKLNLLIFISLFQLSILDAQEWFLYKEFPLNVVPKDIDSSNDGTLFMLSTDFNYYYKPLDGEWIRMNPPVLSNGHSILVDKNLNRMYIGTDYLGIYYTSNYGTTWGNTYLTTNPVSGHHEGYQCLAGTGNPNLFFAGLISFAPQITKFTNQGASGVFKTIDPSLNLNSAAKSMYYTDNQKLLIGTYNNGIWVSENNADSFTQSNYTSGQVYKFTEDSNGRVYALSKNLVNENTSLIMSDDYINWNAVSLPSDSENYTTIFYDENADELWIGSQSNVYKTSVSSIVWQSQNLNNSSTDAVEIISDNNNGLYLFSVNGTAQKLNQNSNSWESQNEGLISETNSITIDSDNQLFTSSNFFSNRISSSYSPEENWRYFDLDLGQAAAGIRNFVINSENKIYSSSYNKIFKSEDNGFTYEELNKPNIENIGILKTGTDNLLYTTEYFGSKLFKSIDDGENWSEIFDGNTIFTFSQIIDVTQNQNGELYLVLLNSSNGFIYNLYGSTDDGENWELLYENDAFSSSISLDGKLFSFGTHSYLVGSHSIYNIQMVSGEPAEIELPFPSNQQMFIQDFKETSNGDWLINYYWENSFKSSDNGNNWTNIGRPTSTSTSNPHPLNDEIILNDIPFWIIPRDNNWNVMPGIYYYLENSMSTNDLSVNHSLIYPNPAKNSVYVKTEFRGTATLYDIWGRILFNTEIKSDKTEISVEDLPSGVYILRLKNGESYKIIKR